MGNKINIGRVQPSVPTDYDATKTYTKLERVYFNNEIFECTITANPGENPTVAPTKWVYIGSSGNMLRGHSVYTFQSMEEAQANFDKIPDGSIFLIINEEPVNTEDTTSVNAEE